LSVASAFVVFFTFFCGGSGFIPVLAPCPTSTLFRSRCRVRRGRGAVHAVVRLAWRVVVHGDDLRRRRGAGHADPGVGRGDRGRRSEEHTSELQSRENLVCRLLLEKKKFGCKLACSLP